MNSKKGHPCVICGRDAGKDYICDRCYRPMKRNRTAEIIFIGILTIIMVLLICGNARVKEEQTDIPQIELEATGYVLQMGDSIWSLYKEFGEGIEWDVFQREILSRNDNAGSFMREGEEIQIVRKK